MSVCPFDSRILGDLFGDAEAARWLGDEAACAAMVRVERALARAGAEVGLVPEAAAQAIDAALADVAIAPGDLAAGTSSAGVPVPALVRALRARLPCEAGRWLHWGATSQDIVDTALVLRLLPVLDLLEARLAALLAALEDAARRWEGLPMAGRTRSQIAAPISFGARCAAWRAPLAELLDELAALRPRIGRVQFGGSVGSNAVIAPHGPAVIAALARELGLAPAPPWHTNRVALASFGAWCAAVAAACAKMAGDLILMGRSESGEATAGAGGGSSTMPQKANPVASETVVALARFAAPLASVMQLAAAPAEERDGAAWAAEWLALPQLVVCAAASLRHAGALAGGLAPDPERMRAALALAGGAALAERATFLLAAEMPRPEAEAVVKRAIERTRGEAATLAEALATLAPGRDWRAALDPRAAIGAAGADEG
jgi:3-carboxy-cis,cis-muconate cycloisomerase